jgi:purine-nucleoside phosphorylase
MTSLLKTSLDARGVSYTEGASWTVDAPFMETHEEVDRYGSEGILTVEMEASALFTVAGVRGADIAAGFAVSDNLFGGKWNPRFHDKRLKASLKTLFDTAVEILGSD